MTNDLYLVDSSVWLEVLPGRAGSESLRQRIDGLLTADVVAIVGMVRLELLAGARTDSEWQRLNELLSGLHSLLTDEALWEQAARMGFELRRHGMTVPSTDLVIAAAAVDAGAVLIHRDHHFDQIAAHLPLKIESYSSV